MCISVFVVLICRVSPLPQTFQLVEDVSPEQIEQSLQLDHSTIPSPAKGAISDYFYGDPRELLSIAQWELVQVHCFT
jgi:hypothetical protein